MKKSVAVNWNLGAELDPNATPSGGAAETQGFTLDIGSNAKVVGYSSTGNGIAPSSDQLLVTVPIDQLDNDGVCFDNVVFSDADGDMLNVFRSNTPASTVHQRQHILLLAVSLPHRKRRRFVEIWLTSHINVGGYQSEVSGLTPNNVLGGSVTGGLIDTLTANSSLLAIRRT